MRGSLHDFILNSGSALGWLSCLAFACAGKKVFQPKEFFLLFEFCLKSDDVDLLFCVLQGIFTSEEEEDLVSEYYRQKVHRLSKILQILHKKANSKHILLEALGKLAKREGHNWFGYLHQKVEQSKLSVSP